MAVGAHETDGAAIHLIPLQGGAARRLVGGFDEVGELAWAPDGRTLAFAARRDANWDVFSIAATGGTPVRLTDSPAYDASPAWSTDGLQLAFVSSRDGRQAVYRISVATAAQADIPAATLVASGEGPLADPAWSPAGEVVFAAWGEGRYRIEAAGMDGTGRRTMVEGKPGEDLRAPSFRSGDTNGTSVAAPVLAYLRVRNGEARLETRAVQADGNLESLPDTVAVQIDRYAWLPSGDAMLIAALSRGQFQFGVRDGTGRLHSSGAAVEARSGYRAPAIAWSRSSPDPALAAVIAPSLDTSPSADRPGLAILNDVDVSGPRIHAGLAEDFGALRQAVAAGVGQDFLGTLSDMWRPLGYDSDRSAFFSWHKTGRAFDTQMELRGPGSRRDLVLVREDDDGRTRWRMFLRAAAQDGSVGRPLDEPGWAFAAGSGDPELTADGGKRGAVVPEGYWLDFTALAAASGWQRIPSLTGSSLNWHRDWVALEYWHYERRDRLPWFEAAAQVYPDEDLQVALHRDRLQELGISLSRLARLGFPSGWFSQG